VLILVAEFTAVAAAPEPRPVVIVLHGLARTPRSMEALAGRIEHAGFAVHNMPYRSTHESVSEAAHAVRERIEPLARDAPALHFVTYSLGGIVVRRLLADWQPPSLGRVVMIAPPNQGSEIVDALRDVPLTRWVYGPAFTELGTDAASTPNTLGPVAFDLGVIAGSRIVSPLGWWLMPGPSDGTVGIERTRIAGMADHIVVPHSHTFIMRAPVVADETVRFLRSGAFSAAARRLD